MMSFQHYIDLNSTSNYVVEKRLKGLIETWLKKMSKSNVNSTLGPKVEMRLKRPHFARWVTNSFIYKLRLENLYYQVLFFPT